MSEFWKDRPVLVTGAGGFTGSHLARRLASAGARVRGVVRPNGSRRPLPDEVEVVEADITKAEDVKRILEGIDTVFNIAAVFRQVKGSRDSLLAIHSGAPCLMIEHGQAAGVRRIVHTSTMGVHGHVEAAPGNEESPVSPCDDYQETKAEGEVAVREAAAKFDMPLTIVRPCGIYGPGDPRFVKLLKPIATGKFFMIGPGKVCFHPVYIDDLVTGFMLAGEKDEGIGETVLIGGPDHPSLNDMIKTIAEQLSVKPPSWRIPVWPIWTAGWICEKLCKLVGIEPPLHPRRVGFFTKNRSFDLSKARRLLGYEPKVNTAEGFARLVVDYRKTVPGMPPGPPPPALAEAPPATVPA